MNIKLETNDKLFQLFHDFKIKTKNYCCYCCCYCLSMENVLCIVLLTNAVNSDNIFRVAAEHMCWWPNQCHHSIYHVHFH